MHATATPQAPPAPGPAAPERRTGAIWVAATGAALLLVAAAVFVAVHWSDLSLEGKVAVVGSITAAALLAGRAMRRTLPATGDVLFHLGALLIPVDIAGAALVLGADWEPTLLVEGVVTSLVFPPLARGARTRLLLWAAGAGVVAFAGGVAATTGIASPAVLAIAAVIAHVARRKVAGIGFALVAGLAPAAALGIATLTGHSALLVDLGLTGRGHLLSAAASGLVAAGVLAIAAKERDDLPLAGLAGVSLASSAWAAWGEVAATTEMTIAALASAFLVLEAGTSVVRRDPFWSRPARAVAAAGELVVALAAPVTAVVLAAAPFVGTEGRSDSHFDPVMAIAMIALAGGWLVAGLRRDVEPGDGSAPPAFWDVAALPLAVSLIAAALMSTGSLVIAAAVAIAVVLASGWLTGPIATASSCAAALAAPYLLFNEPRWVAYAGFASCIALAVPLARRDVASDAIRGVTAATAALAGALLAAPHGPRSILMASAAVVIWSAASLADRAQQGGGAWLRWGIALTPIFAIGDDHAIALIPALVATAILVVDAWRVRDTVAAAGASFTVQLVVADLALTAGLDGAWTGVALCVSALVWAGLAAVVDDDERRWLLIASGLAVTTGLALATGDVVAFADALIVTGGLVLGAGLMLANPVAGHAGGVTMIIGLWLHLAMNEVGDLEPYTAPVALHLLVAGALARRRGGVSSWAAFAPSIVLLGGSGLLERIEGGAGWHAVLAGMVAIAAVAAGGWLRLAGPLFVGTALLFAVTTYESLATLATVPTWAWLALGGCVLLGTGVAMERSDLSPVDASKRAVDVIRERFD